MLEVIFVRFHFARGEHLKTHLRQNAQHAAQLLRGRMQTPNVFVTPRQGHIQFFFSEGFRQRGLFHRCGFFFQRSLKRHLDTVRSLTDSGSLLFREFAQAGKDSHQFRTAPQVGHTPSFHCGWVIDLRQRSERGFFDLV